MASIHETNPRPWIPEFTPIEKPPEIIYEWESPENPLFNYFRNADQNTTFVEMDFGKISIGDKKLLSWGFTGCSGLILRQTDGNSSALLHMVGNELTHRQQLTIVGLAQNGPLDALLLKGKWAYPLSVNYSGLYRFALSERIVYQHQDDGGRFDVMYDPHKRMAYQYARGEDTYYKKGPHIVQVPF